MGLTVKTGFVRVSIVSLGISNEKGPNLIEDIVGLCLA